MAAKRRVGKYEVGRTIGEGNFAKVKFARNTETGECVAMKVMAKSTILKNKMVDQIKREISIMKIVRHPYVVRLHEVLAGRSKIYIVLEFVTGGELYDKIVHQRKLPEKESRRYFQQLIDAVSHCHKKGVYHRDLKPENLLLDSRGNLKVSDFGLSALPQEGVKLLYTTCGTPNYLAPEVLSGKGYDGAAADVWSCGVILYVLMAGYLPFEETDLPSLYKKVQGPVKCFSGASALLTVILGISCAVTKILSLPASHEMYTGLGIMILHHLSPLLNSLFVLIFWHQFGIVAIKINAADFSCPFWLSRGATLLIRRILDPNPKTRITIEGIKVDPWFSENYIPVRHGLEEEVNLDDVRAVFDDIEDQYVAEQSGGASGPLVMNAFEMITLSQGLNLSALFDRRQDYVKRQTRFVSREPAKTIISTVETVAESMGLKVHTRSFKTRLEGIYSKVGPLAVVLEIYEVAPSLFMVDVRKAAGDTLEYHKFYKSFTAKLDHIILKSRDGTSHPSLLNKLS